MSVRLALLDRPVDLVEDGLDVAVRIGKLADSSAIAVRVGAMRRVMVAAPGYLKHRGRPAAPADLASHDVIAFVGMDRIDRWRFANGVEARIKPRLVVNTAEAAIDTAIAGFGITRVLSYQAVDALSGRSLVRLMRQHETGAAPVHVVYPEGRHPPPKLRAFVDVLVPRLRQRCGAIARSLDK
jgi:DNA-binding transcriptional LysR family regulator